MVVGATLLKTRHFALAVSTELRKTFSIARDIVKQIPRTFHFTT
jgi:hypothetical protein